LVTCWWLGTTLQVVVVAVPSPPLHRPCCYSGAVVMTSHQATPDSKPGAFLVMGANDAETAASIAQFSARDASRFAE
jgi:hypothetical protein